MYINRVFEYYSTIHVTLEYCFILITDNPQMMILRFIKYTGEIVCKCFTLEFE